MSEHDQPEDTQLRLQALDYETPARKQKITDSLEFGLGIALFFLFPTGAALVVLKGPLLLYVMITTVTGICIGALYMTFRDGKRVDVLTRFLFGLSLPIFAIGLLAVAFLGIMIFRH